MKIADVVNQLRGVLPKYTDYFSNVLTVSSITAAGGVATIVTASAHGLTSGANIVLTDVVTRTAINGVSQSGLSFTFTTASAHDLTLGWPAHEFVTLDGFTDAGWNGEFYLTAVSNRQTFTVRSTNSLPTLNGNEVLKEIRIDGVNGRYSVTVVDPVTITISGAFIDGIYEGGTVSTAQRISGAVNELRAYEQYTEQGLNELWMFVVMADANVSKDRSTYSDATATKPGGNDMRLRLIDGFSLIIIADTTTDIMATDALDICRHELLLPILKSVNGIRFTSGLTYTGDFRTVLTGHSIAEYDRSVLVYRYDFETVMDLTNNDTVEAGDTRAFLDADYTHYIGGDDTQPLTILPMDMDEVPL